MKQRLYILAWGLFSVGVLPVLGQEEESAEVFLESYTDLFQEKFFEALKQKGIENYDRAEALFLECKQMQPENPVVDHELAKTLLVRKQYAPAEAYALAAVSAAPSEYWYLHTLMETLEPQYKDLALLSGALPLESPSVRKNLAKWHIANANRAEALSALKGLPDDKQTRILREKANLLTPVAGAAAADKPESGAPGSDSGRQAAGRTAGQDRRDAYGEQIQALLASGSWKQAIDIGVEALESYPLQLEFYLGLGRALIGAGKYQLAIDRLKEGEVLILEPGATASGIYAALAEAYEKLGDSERARHYENKAKSLAE